MGFAMCDFYVRFLAVMLEKMLTAKVAQGQCPSALGAMHMLDSIGRPPQAM